MNRERNREEKKEIKRVRKKKNKEWINFKEQRQQV